MSHNTDLRLYLLAYFLTYLLLMLFRAPVPRFWCPIQLPGIQQRFIQKHLRCVRRPVKLYVKYRL